MLVETINIGILSYKDFNFPKYDGDFIEYIFMCLFVCLFVVSCSERGSGGENSHIGEEVPKRPKGVYLTP